jgi:hypothetical protein
MLALYRSGRHAEALSAYRDACAWTARGHLGWAEALSARGDAAGAREHATRALELAREHGFGVFEPRAAALVETESAAGTPRPQR